MTGLNDVQAFVSKATLKELDEVMLSIHAERKRREEEKRNQLRKNFFDAWEALQDAGYNVFWDSQEVLLTPDDIEIYG